MFHNRGEKIFLDEKNIYKKCSKWCLRFSRPEWSTVEKCMYRKCMNARYPCARYIFIQRSSLHLSTLCIEHSILCVRPLAGILIYMQSIRLAISSIVWTLLSCNKNIYIPFGINFFALFPRTKNLFDLQDLQPIRFEFTLFHLTLIQDFFFIDMHT